MENYVVSALKYRPSTFTSVVGQRALTQTLKNAIISNKLAHAYLFCGPRGVGKTTCARIFAKSINCTNPTSDNEACNQCESCMAFNEQRSYNILELDAASNNSVDDIRSLTDQVRIPPQIGTYKVFIIDEVHMLSQAAFNAFLKTLEEPPRHAIFILATTEKHKILPTILSRCQIYDFHRITINDTIEHLRYVAANEGINAEEEALAVIAQKSDGGMRDALSLFDQMSAFSEGNITYKMVISNLNMLDYEYYFRLTSYILMGDVPKALVLFDEVLKNGFDGQLFISGLSNHLRDLLVCKDPSTVSLLEVGERIANAYAKQAAEYENQLLYALLELTNRCDFNYKLSNNRRLMVELTLIQCCQLTQKKNSNSEVDSAPKLQSISPNSGAGGAQPAQGVATQSGATNTSAHTQPQQSTPKVEIKPKEEVVIKIKKPQAKVEIKPLTTPSITKRVVQQSEAVKEVAKSVDYQNRAFTQEELNKAWLEYTLTCPKETILVNTMKLCTPYITTGSSFELKVTNADQVARINNNRDTIIPFLRNALKNSNIELNVIQDENVQKSVIFSPMDKLKFLTKNNPAIEELFTMFDLEL